MRQVVEESLDVGIEHYSIPFTVEFQRLLHRLMAVAARPETVGRVMKHGLEDGCQKSCYHTFCPSVFRRLFLNLFPRVSRQERGRANSGLQSRGLTFLMEQTFSPCLCQVLPFIPLFIAELLRRCCNP